MNPSIFLAIVLSIFVSVAALFFLLGRLFFRPLTASDGTDNGTALHGRLQQLFHLHDCGVDQALIDALPIFLYKSVVGLKHPFDCAVCLSEFHTDDKLRLLPKCCHAFHLDCIDTWLLSHSTCPLCRGSVQPDSGGSGCSSSAVGVLELGGGSFREIRSTGEAIPIAIAEGGKSEAHLGFSEEGESSSSYVDREDARIVSVKLGKFRSIDGCGGSEYTSSNDCSLDGRKCFSMGSVEYVLDESSVLQVEVRVPPPLAKQAKWGLDASLCKAIHLDPSSSCSTTSGGAERVIQNEKRESCSVSKMWFRSKQVNPSFQDSSRRAFSFRLPISWVANNESRAKQKACGVASEAEIGKWGSDGEELGLEVEIGRVSGRSELASKGRTTFAR